MITKLGHALYSWTSACVQSNVLVRPEGYGERVDDDGVAASTP